MCIYPKEQRDTERACVLDTHLSELLWSRLQGVVSLSHSLSAVRPFGFFFQEAIDFIKALAQNGIGQQQFCIHQRA